MRCSNTANFAGTEDRDGKVKENGVNKNTREAEVKQKIPVLCTTNETHQMGVWRTDLEGMKYCLMKTKLYL